MAADIEEEEFTEGKTMRITGGNRRKKLLVDHRVEVRSFEEGFQGSWHSGTVVACKRAIRSVKYDHLLFDDRSSSKLIDFVEVPAIVDGIISTKSSPSNYRGWIRPLPHPLDCDIWFLHYGQCVDVFYQDAWWEGVVFDHQDGSLERLIFFPDMGDEMKVHIHDLRISQDWDENTEFWKPRGNWLFLEVIEEIEKDWPLLVSVRQIWYDVRVMDSFKNLKEWTSSLIDIWKELVLQVIVDNFKITVKEFFHHLNSSANLLQEGYQLLELNEFAFDALLKQKAYFGDSRPIVPVETTGQLKKACCHPFEEEIGRDDLASGMESDRLDKIPLASLIKPIHEAPWVRSPAVAILPSNPDVLSKDSSNFKVPKRRIRHSWIPAGPDIVPEAEYCADAINEYCKFYSMSKAGYKQSVDIKVNARKHLAFLGWKIEISREKGVQRVRYVQPGSDRKCFPSLLTVCEYLRESDSKPDKLSSSTSSKMPIQSTQRNWLPAGVDVVPETEFCEDAIIEYYNIFKTGNLPPKDLVVNCKKHLSFLGWKIECLQEKHSQRWRYTLPGYVGKSFKSLIKVCEYLTKSASGIVSLFPQDEHLSPLTEQSQGCKDNLIKPSPNFIIESEYCPQAVTDYYLLGVNSNDDPRKWKRDDKLKDMQLKAKKHLSAVGWRFYYTYRSDKMGSRELRYISLSGKVYTTLLAACKGYVVEERDVWKEAEGQLTSEANLEVHGPFISQRPLCEKRPAETSGLSLSSEVANLGKVKVQRIRKRGRKRKSSAPHIASRSSKSLKKEKDLKEGQTTKSRDILNVAVSTRVLRSSKRACQVVAPSSSHSNPRTVLSWLIDNNAVLPRAKVQYRGRRDDGTLAEGRVTRDGIRCSCCQDIFTLSNFEGHAGSTYHRPSANIFLEDGRSLLDCQLQLKRDINARSSLRESREMKSNQHHNKNDYICSVCHFGGELVLCDRCPSSFHTYCLGLKEVPDGDWFCPSCCCKICGQSKISKDIEEFGDSSVINCHQCELQYHIGCLKMKGLVPDRNPKGLWFCNRRCEQISSGLQKLMGKPVPVGVDNLTWTLLRYTKPGSCDHDPSNIEDLTETYSKLNVALGVMHECFEPVKEPRTRRDLVEDVIFNRWSELNRLNFQGFYTVLLEKNDELITAATVRVYGEKVAEVPLVATRFLYRRRGMCRILMNELEKALMELGVERLVLPAVSSVLDTWISSFGFSRMTESERLNYLDYMFLDFQGTIMCQKLLMKTPCTESVPLRTEKQLFDVIYRDDNMDLEGSSVVSEIIQADRVEDSGSVDQKFGNTARGNGNGNDGGKDAAALVLLVNQPTGFESIPCQSEISLESLVEASDYKEDENHGNGQIICYKRRRISKPVGAEVCAC